MVTRKEMIDEMLEALDSKRFKKDYYEAMMKKSKKQVEVTYNAWKEDDKQHVSFYVALLEKN